MLDRRRFLVGAGALGTLGVLGTAVPDRAAKAAGTIRFAVVSDTHADPGQPARLEILKTIFASIERADPTFVVNCGDITEYGAPEEFEAYFSTIPAGLRDRIRHVPGNHETRWDESGTALFQSVFGATPFSFDAGGIHFVGLDPTAVLQEPGIFGATDLNWLRRDLAKAGADTPSVMFLHFPMGADNYYVNDQDEFLALADRFDVRGIFAGHIHTEQVHRFNGLTQIAADDAKSGPVYYWVEQSESELRVSRVAVSAAGQDTRTAVATIPLTGSGEGRSERPRRVSVDSVRPGRIRIVVEPGSAARVAAVRATVYPQHRFGGKDAASWIDLAKTTARWSGEIDVAALPAGHHRLQLRIVNPSGAWFEHTEPFRIARIAGDPAPAWDIALSGHVQGALATDGEMVVAGSSHGEVAAIAVSGSRGRIRWRTTLGPIYRGATFDASARTVFVPSTDHGLYALRANNGRTKWRYDAGAPVLSAPLVSAVDGQELVLVTAGHTLHAIDAGSGQRRWSVDSHGFFAGRPACDGERVYIGSGDGNAYAYDARTGAQLWSFSTTTRTTPYTRLIYGPWDDVIERLPGDGILVSTVASAYALDAATGVQRWAVAGGFLFAPALATGHGVLMIDEWGKVRLADPATGTARWTADVGARVLNSGVVIDGERAWVLATTGLLVGLDLATGQIRQRLQLGPSNSYSTPVIVDGVLVAADQSGAVRGVSLSS